MSDYEIITIGGGPNGLMTSALLQAEGHKVCVLELNDHVGGLASNAHDFPGYVHNRGMWFLMFADVEKTLGILELEKYGLELVDPPTQGLVLPEEPGGPAFRFYTDPIETLEGVAEDFGEEAMDGFIQFQSFLSPFAVGMQAAMLNPPLSIGEMINAVPSHEGQMALQKIFYGSAMDLIDEFLPDKVKYAPLRAYIAGLACDGFYGGPMTPGSALTIAYHFGAPTEHGTAMYRWPKGHTGMFSEAIARSFVDKGGTLKLNSDVKRILIKDNKAYGVELVDGTQFTADLILSSCDAYNTFINMVGEDVTPPWLVNAIKHINYDETLCQGYLTFNGLPEFRDEYAQFNEGLWRWNVWNMGNAENFEKSWDSIKYGENAPYVRGGLLIPSMIDPSTAPAGHHTGTFCMSNSWPIHVTRDRLPEVKEATIRNMMDHYAKFYPNWYDVLEDYKLMTPIDYEDMYRNTGGGWAHGMVKIDQMFDCRPVKGMSDNRTPFKNLYLCGSSNHPGPGVNGRTPLICIKQMKKDGVIK